ncbi:hypothetical protein [Acidihalobacter ferrooxydans]|nr:hypothetical protein [Acidihalobacter ferrooxydans]
MFNFYLGKNEKNGGFLVVCALTLFALSGCATIVQQPSSSPDRAMPGVIQQERAHRVAMYMREVDGILGHSLRIQRVQDEAAKMKEAGHPVPLSTGWCDAVAVVRYDGKVVGVRDTQCASQELESEMRRAIMNASPLPPPPLIDHKEAYVYVRLYAPVATPGVDGN